VGVQNGQVIAPSYRVERGAFAALQAKFGTQMLNIKEIQEFAARHPAEFREIMQEMNLHSRTLAFASDVPLRKFMRKGKLFVESDYSGETRQLIIPTRSLRDAGIDLRKEKPLLLLHGGYKVEAKGNIFTITIDPAFAKTLGQFLRLLEKPDDKDYRLPIDGVPAGELSSDSDKRILCIRIYNGFGPVMRVNNSLSTVIGNEIHIGLKFSEPGVALVRELQQEQKARQAQTL
jgi:hypothetical protein